MECPQGSCLVLLSSSHCLNATHIPKTLKIYLPPVRQTYISTCLLNIFMWRSKKYTKLSMSQTEFLIFLPKSVLPEVSPISAWGHSILLLNQPKLCRNHVLFSFLHYTSNPSMNPDGSAFSATTLTLQPIASSCLDYNSSSSPLASYPHMYNVPSTQQSQWPFQNIDRAGSVT